MIHDWGSILSPTTVTVLATSLPQDRQITDQRSGLVSIRWLPTHGSCKVCGHTIGSHKQKAQREMKAFLSHSSSDNEIVHEVARQIGRVFVSLDINEFHAADDLVQSMESAVRDSAIFVYFASRSAMDSSWVAYEANEAKYYNVINRIKKLIVVILDDRIQPSDFPDWMRRVVFFKSHAPRPIARMIRGVIDDLVSEEQSGFFVGRSGETASLQAALVPPDDSGDVSIVTVRGLPGIGRRTLLQRVVRDSLSVDRLLTVRVEVGDNVNSITAKLADLVESIVAPDDTIAMVQQIQSQTRGDASARFAADVNRALDLHELVVLYDEGGILDNNGFLASDVELLLAQVASGPDLLVALVTNRRPRIQESTLFDNFPIVDVAPLRESEVRQLIALKARARGLTLTTAVVSGFVDQARGYPPNVTALIELAEVYGSQLIATSASSRTEYRPRPLARYLSSLSLSTHERKLISVLAHNNPLPLPVLMLFAPEGETGIAALTKLIDASLIIPQQGTSWYRISDPISDYVDREFPPCTIEDYTLVASELEGFLDEDRDTGAYLELSRVFYRALIHAGQDRRPRAFALHADWLRLAADFYHRQRNYQKALDFAITAYQETPEQEALSWMIRSNVKLGNFQRALSDIEIMRNIGEIREAYFLRGFLERNRGEYRVAIEYYQKARHAGRGGVALERDLAECYLQTGDLELASEHIAAAQSRQSDNPYVLSLRIKIACRQRDEETARSLLPLLDQVDSPTFAAHRRSMVELTFGFIDQAYSYALKAVRESTRPPAEALANLANCQILVGKADAAIQTLNRLESLYGARWSDVLNSLRARAATAEDRYEDAWDLCNMLIRDNAQHTKLKVDVLTEWLDKGYLPTSERRKKEDLLAELRVKLATFGGAVDDSPYYWDT